ncbi:MAG TPA: NUDIX hydrolase [Mycobacteriales bacterium]|nr:NUDIX hydrolase [Mycobacteriales bacterium]
MSSPVTGVVIRAAGGLLWRPGRYGVEVAIVHRPRYDDWSMPKGKLQDGEHPLHGACREVVEETGVRPKVGRRLPQQEYVLGPDRKTVDYWDMTARGGEQFVPSDEVDTLRWLRPAEAATWLSYERDRDLLRAFLTVPPATAMVLLVRHARAGERTSWPGDDRLRPLDPEGRRQAEALRGPLKWFGPERIFSADPLRCLQTVASLAEDLGLPVESEPAFSEQAYAEDRERALRRVLAMAAESGPAVVCSQRGVIPDLVGTLAAENGLRLGKVIARKASVWALSFVDDRVVAADYYPDLADGRGG